MIATGSPQRAKRFSLRSAQRLTASMIATEGGSQRLFHAAIMCSTPDGIDDRDGCGMKPRSISCAAGAQRLTASMIATDRRSGIYAGFTGEVLNA